MNGPNTIGRGSRGRRLITLVILTLAAAAAADPSGAAAAQTYTFKKIVDLSGPFNNFGAIDINDSGTVAFWASRDAGGQGVFTGSGGAITTIADSSGELFQFDLTPSINSAGTVAFTASRDVTAGGGAGLYIGNGGAITTLVDTRGPMHMAAQPSINASGTVAFVGSLDSNIFQGGIFTTRGGSSDPPTQIATHPSHTFQWPIINDAGIVAFTMPHSGFLSISSTLAGGGAAVTPLVDTSGPFNSFGATDMNASGTIPFVAGLDADNGGVGGAIYTISAAGVITPIADASGPFRHFSGAGTAIDDNGNIAFWAALDNGEEGIFTGPDAVADKVIATGDTLFGQQVLSLSAPRVANNGEIVFRYGSIGAPALRWRAFPSRRESV